VLNITVGLACTAADIKDAQDGICEVYQDALRAGDSVRMGQCLALLDTTDREMDNLRSLARI
jgi:hypothetical protein